MQRSYVDLIPRVWIAIYQLAHFNTDGTAGHDLNSKWKPIPSLNLSTESTMCVGCVGEGPRTALHILVHRNIFVFIAFRARLFSESLPLRQSDKKKKNSPRHSQESQPKTQRRLILQNVK